MNQKPEESAEDLETVPDYSAFLAELALHTSEETGLTYPQLIEMLKKHQIRGIWRMGDYTASLPVETVFFVPSIDNIQEPALCVDFDVVPWDNEGHELWLAGGYEYRASRAHDIKRGRPYQPLWD